MRPPRVLTATILLCLALSGCTQAAAPPPAAQPAGFGGTDLAWVQLMIPLDEQLLPVLDRITSRSTDKALTAVAADLRTVYTAELPRLKALRDRAGLPTTNPHEGHKMPGLVDADQLSTLDASTGAAFDKQATDCLRAHLGQLATLAGEELTNGTSQAVKSLAESVRDTRTTRLRTLPAA